MKTEIGFAKLKTDYRPPHLFGSMFPTTGLERWEVNRIAYLNQQAADDCKANACRARARAAGLRETGNSRWMASIKYAIILERDARQRSERAECLRKIALTIPYPDGFEIIS